MAYGPLKELLSNSVRSDYYSHILLIPLVSGILMFQKRKEIFAGAEYSLEKGFPVQLAGIIFFIAGWMLQDRLNINDYTSIIMLSVVVFWIGGFVTSYGTRAFRNARFPMLFLVFMIPIPTSIMDRSFMFCRPGLQK